MLKIRHGYSLDLHRHILCYIITNDLFYLRKLYKILTGFRWEEEVNSLSFRYILESVVSLIPVWRLCLHFKKRLMIPDEEMLFVFIGFL